MRHGISTFLTFFLPVLELLTVIPIEAEVIDRVVAVVNGQVVTQSFMENDKRMREILAGPLPIQPVGSGPQKEEDQSLDLVIDQSLIREQMKQYAEVKINPDQVTAELDKLIQTWGGEAIFADAMNRRNIDLEHLKVRIQWQLAVLKFIDARFRQFVVIEPKEIADYYNQALVPELVKKGISAPPQKDLEEKIRTLLVEEKVSQQLEDWLKSLRQNASVQLIR